MHSALGALLRERHVPLPRPLFYLLPATYCAFVSVFISLSECFCEYFPCKDINPNCAWHLSAPLSLSLSSRFLFVFPFSLRPLLLLYLVAFLSVSLSAIIRRTKSANILSDTQICKYAAHTHAQADICVCVCVCVVLLKLRSSQRHRQL